MTLRPSHPGTGNIIALFLILTLFLNYIWELGQVEFFANFEDAPFSKYALHCFVASLGDVVIASVAYAAVATLFRKYDWLIRPGLAGPFIAYLGIGQVITVAIELYATSTKVWTYADTMPTILGIGLTPVLQWFVVPSITAFLVRAVSLHSSRQ